MEGLPSEVVNRRGLYDVTLYRVVHDRSLRQETIFECVLSIPATQYQIARRLIYYPGLTLSFFLLVCLCLESLPEPILSNCVTSSPPRHCINLPPPTRLGLFVPQGEIGWWRRKKKLNISYTPSKIHHLRQNGGLLNPTATPFLSFHPTGREKKSFKDGKKKKGHLFRPFEKWIDNPLFAQHDKIKSGALVCVCRLHANFLDRWNSFYKRKNNFNLWRTNTKSL